MKEELTTAWWVEIQTITPRCIYYFGPFDTSEEANAAYPGYIDDLDSEGAQGIVVIVKHSQQPELLTIFDDEAEM